MYEHLRNKFGVSLGDLGYSNTEVNEILSQLDVSVRDFEIKEMCTQVSVGVDLNLDLLKVYLNSKALEGLSKNSIKFYKLRLETFLRDINKPIGDITTNDIRGFLYLYKKSRGVSDRTLDKYRQIINVFFEWLSDNDYINKNVCKNIKEIKYAVTPRRSLTRRELESLRNVAMKKGRKAIALVDTLYSTGCRISELINIKLSDINVYEKSVRILGKGKVYNTVYFNDRAQISIDDYLDNRGDNTTVDYLFITDYKPYRKLTSEGVEFLFREMSKEVGFKVTPHVMRHTAATLGLQSGMTMTQVQRMLGHKNISTTQIYAETSQEEVKESHRKYIV